VHDGAVATDVVIEIRDLYKRYGDLVAVAGVDLDVTRGEVVGMLGPNGAGKTSTVEICEGYRRASSGTVRVLGEDPAHASRQWRSRIGLVLQGSAPSDELTVFESIDQYAQFFPEPRTVDDVIALVGLEDKRDTKAGGLSGGQQRRLDVALGIVGRPEVVFLDEPTTGFDPEARRQFWDVLRGLRAEGTTIVLTTHYLDEAEALCDRVVVLAGGQIRASGPPSSLGGRDHGGAVVRWMQDGEHREAASDTPTTLVAELARQFGGEVPALTVTRPTLEDIYLRLIGPHQ
jgi:ABC-2 type transport system ATP-binding protein